MTDPATYWAHIAITIAFAAIGIGAIALLAQELVRDILPYTKGDHD